LSKPVTPPKLVAVVANLAARRAQVHAAAEGAREPVQQVPAPESEAELRLLLDQSTLGLRFVDPGGRILWANAAELALTGRRHDEYVGHDLSEFFAEPGTAADLLQRLARAEPVAGYPARLRAADGSVKEVLIDGSALFRDGRLVHSRCFTRDITPVLRLEQAARVRAEETSHLQDDFLALLSHELRAPLGTVLLWLGLLRQGGSDADEIARALEIMHRSACTLEHIVEDLLHASRIAAGGLTLNLERLDLRGVVLEALEAAAGDAAVNGLELSPSFGDQPAWIMGDPGRLQQAVSNLLANAIKFTPAGGRVHVAVDAPCHHARLRVSDTGEGMNAGFLPFAFGRFRQQDSTKTRTHQGLGLGLYVVRQVVEHHGGQVEAESPGPGLGSTFTVLLPAAQANGEAQAHPAAARTELLPAGLRVLVVDDDDDVREALLRLLQQHGASVTGASSAAAAFAAVEERAPDVIVSDVAMPGEDGLSLIRRLRLLPPDRGGRTPAAALSAYASGEDRRLALQAGFQEHLRKPVEPAQLVAALARIVRDAAAAG
jgi:PAS domain S-box-containing protein